MARSKPLLSINVAINDAAGRAIELCRQQGGLVLLCQCHHGGQLRKRRRLKVKHSAFRAAPSV
jgi:hypothetical protein